MGAPAVSFGVGDIVGLVPGLSVGCDDGDTEGSNAVEGAVVGYEVGYGVNEPATMDATESALTHAPFNGYAVLSAPSGSGSRLPTRVTHVGLQLSFATTPARGFWPITSPSKVSCATVASTSTTIRHGCLR